MGVGDAKFPPPDVGHEVDSMPTVGVEAYDAALGLALLPPHPLRKKATSLSPASLSVGPKPMSEIAMTSFRRATATGCESLQAQPSGGTSKSPQLLVQIVVLGDIRGTSEPQSTRIIISILCLLGQDIRPSPERPGYARQRNSSRLRHSSFAPSSSPPAQIRFAFVLSKARALSPPAALLGQK